MDTIFVSRELDKVFIWFRRIVNSYQVQPTLVTLEYLFDLEGI